jgi:hypothetical protein
MKMDIFFGSLFWGILLILWGLSLILKSFQINMPLVKVFVAIIIILFGIKLLIGGNSRVIKTKSHHSSGSSYYKGGSQGEYTMVFSGGTIDLMDLKADAKDLEINVVFGSAVVLLPSDLSFDIHPTTVFGGTVLPERSQYGIGESTYSLNSAQENAPINIESSCVFGRLEYVIKDRSVPKATEPLSPGATTGEF